MYQNAIPTLFESNIERENVELSYCDMDIGIDQYHESIQFSNLCRICGELCSAGIRILSVRGVELKLKDKIELHMPVTLDAEDLMPQKICIDCCNKLEITHALAISCLKTDMRLRKCLNIEEIPYDKKYSAILEEYSLKVSEEIHAEKGIQSIPSKYACNKIKETIVKHKSHTELGQLESTIHKNNFEDATIEIRSHLNDFIETYRSQESERDEHANERRGDMQINKEVDKTNAVSCLNCKEPFETQEGLKSHKIFYSREKTPLVGQKMSDSATVFKGSKEKQLTQSEFLQLFCNAACHENFENETLLEKHKLLHCKLLTQNSCWTSNNIETKDENQICNTNLHNGNKVPAECKKQCGYCDLIYSTKEELLTHITECHGSRFVFKCTTCNKKFSKWSSLDIHEATHRLDKPYLCDLCGKSFKHSNNLRGHKRIHLDETKKKGHICETCGSAFRSRFHLREHMNQHDGNKPYSCEQCGKAFHKRIQLRQHKLSHGSNKYICPVCNATFNRRGNMSTHLKRHSGSDGTYTCSVCSCRCKSMSELKLHRKKHTEQDIIDSIKKKCINKPVWQCEVCNRVFSKQAILLDHERVHKGERHDVECDICGKKLANKRSLLYHKKAIHSTERPHMCQYCGESFVSKEARLIHERVHTGERPYVCHVCDMRYKCSSNLNQHMRTHSGTKPHKCTYCDKRFTRKGALNVHERIHIGMKPFSCEACSRTFTQKNDMLKHTKTHDIKVTHCEKYNLRLSKNKDIVEHAILHAQNNSIIEEYVGMQQSIQPCTISIICPEIEQCLV